MKEKGKEMRSKRILVTGGGGFLGGYIVRALLEHPEELFVGSFTRSPQPELEALGVRVHRGDLANAKDVQRIFEEERYDAVIHAAAMVNPWGDRVAFYRANVTGTQVLLDASIAAGVERFVFTSSPSAVFDGTPMVNAVAEDVPYPTIFPSPYGETKALSEQLVQQAHDPTGSGLATVSLRPQLMWGPGDPHVLPLIIRNARAGKLRQIGPRDVKIDVTCVENAARAHIDALQALDKPLEDPTYPGGKIYFISNDEATPIWDFIPRALAASGEPAMTAGVLPRRVALLAGKFVELTWKVFDKKGEPPISKYVVLKMCTDQWYDMTPARRDLGYEPTVTLEQGLAAWASWYEAHRLTT